MLSITHLHYLHQHAQVLSPSLPLTLPPPPPLSFAPSLLRSLSPSLSRSLSNVSWNQEDAERELREAVEAEAAVRGERLRQVPVCLGLLSFYLSATHCDRSLKGLALPVSDPVCRPCLPSPSELLGPCLCALVSVCGLGG